MLLQRVAAVAKKTVVVLVSGRPITFESGLCVAKPKSSQERASMEEGKGEGEGGGVEFPWDRIVEYGRGLCARGSIDRSVGAAHGLEAGRAGRSGAV